MSNSLFRKKALDRVASPEQLNEYIRVSTPSVWMVLAAVVVLLLGICVWGVFGRLDTVLPVTVIRRGGTATAYVRETDAQKVQEGMAVTLAGETGRVLSVGAQPLKAQDALTEYERHVGGLQEGDWVYALALEADCADGVYAAQIVIESVSPMSFVLN